MPGPGYATALDAFKNGAREKLLYVTCARHNSQHPDVLATVDVDNHSPTFGKVIHRLPLSHAGDEIHHSGWNACSSCFGDSSVKRSHLLLPCLHSSRIYVANTSDNPRKPSFDAIIEPNELYKEDVSFGHTTHCLADGRVMISTLGDKDDNGKGNFILLDSKTFKTLGLWGDKSVPYGYDYWYQPYYNIMISTAWGSPKAIKQGFNLDHVKNGEYGHEMYVWNWKEQTLKETLVLDPVKGMMPLEIRFKHDPRSPHAFVGCALGGTVYHIYHDQNTGRTTTKCVIELPNRPVKGWILPEMPALITDILISLDDRFLYVSTWLHGELLQYDITDPFRPFFTGKVQIGGAVRDGVRYADGTQPTPTVIQGRRVEGGSQMLQLSLDGKRMYVTNSLYSVWDHQFFPDMTKNGSSLVVVDVDIKNGGMKLNENLNVDFTDELGPIFAHEMRYPGGDCSSDIWLDPSQAESCCAPAKI